MSWQQWGIVLGAMVAGVTLYHLAVSPARESARSEAQIRATLDQHTAAIANLEKQTETDRKSVADRFDILRERLDAAGKDTAGLRLDIAAIRGQLGVLLERTKK